MVLRLTILLAVIAVVWQMPATDLTTPWLLAVAGLFALAIGIYLRAYPLFLHRAVLTGCTTDESFIRRWFWRGNLVSIGALLTGSVASLLLLSVAPSYERHHWIALTLVALLLVVMERPTRRCLAPQASRAFLPILQRRLLTRVVVFAAVAGTASWEFWWIDHPDLRNWDTAELMVERFQAGWERFAAPLAGAVAGGLSAGDALVMHFAQRYAPGMDNLLVRLGLWVALLCKSALQLVPAILVLTATSMLFDLKRDQGWRAVGANVFAGPFLLTFTLLAALSFFAHQGVEELTADPAGPISCAPDRKDLLVLDTARREEAQGLKDSTRAVLRSELAAVLASAEPAIDDFLDWQYSLRGEYSMLLWAAAREFEARLTEEMAGHFGEIIDRGIFGANEAAAAHISGRVPEAQRRAAEIIQPRTLDPGCIPPWWHGDELGAPNLVVAKAPPVALAAFGGAFLAKQLAPRLAAKAASRLVLKYGGVGGAMTLGTLCGPAMPLCAVGIGVLSWLVLDLMVIEADEFLTREAVREEIVTALSQHLEQAERLLAAHYDAEIVRNVDAVFRIPRDGL